MFLTVILALTLITLIVITVTAIVAGGAAFIIVFGDVILCVIILGWIIKRLFKHRKK